MGINYTTPLHRRNVFTKIKFQGIKQNRWIEGKNCNNTSLNSSNYVSCQLFKVDPEDVFDIQLILQNDTEIIAQKTVYASFDASRWFFCYAGMVVYYGILLNPRVVIYCPKSCIKYTY